VTSTDTSRQDQPRNDLALAEAALFLSPQPLTRRALAKILGGVALAYVDQLWEDLKERYEDADRGIELHIEDGRAMLRVKAVYVNQVAHLAPQQDIPRPVLRTLAVIAYNHPMTQADLIKVRGNKGYGHVQELIERGLIIAEEQGRTLLLSVTKEFLRHFGLTSVEEFRFHFAASPDADEAVEETEAQESLTEEPDEEDHGTRIDPDDGAGIATEDDGHDTASEDEDRMETDRTTSERPPSRTEPRSSEDETPEEVEDG
jgi:segregation and condensation protein B